jgi:aspartyl/asparaginyl beta-hydroxylase (cupin superfamily)
LFAQAERASAEGKGDVAIAAYETIVKLDPANPRALNALGSRLLDRGKIDRARALLERAAASDPSAVPIWLNLAAAAREAADPAGELAALEKALVADPYAVLALLQKGRYHERYADRESAVRTYGAMLACIPPDDQLPPNLLPLVNHARALVRTHGEEREALIRDAVNDLGLHSDRFDYCLSLMTGRKRLYYPTPSGVHFPYLPAVPFFERSQFPWFEELEAGTDTFREEFLNVAREDAGFRPYVNIAPGLPVNQWAQLNGSLSWSAFFLWENGVRNEVNAARCPGSIALLERLPLHDIEGQGPTMMFSLLKPGAHIPPHTGVSNIRAVVHLPLIVPQDCGFRVGAETREWEVGKAFAFDDTIEHEAWNRSSEPRAVLIIDAWNPYLTEDERTLLRVAAKQLMA